MSQCPRFEFHPQHVEAGFASLDWNELLDLFRDGYRMTAAKKLLERLKEK
ncbi:MAG: hypothetical protein ABJB95_06020 [Gemmatimonadales bacterium]